MEIIHSLKSLVQIELSDLFAVGNSINWPGEIDKLPSVEVLSASKLANTPYKKILRGENYHLFQAIFRWLHRSQTRLSTVEYRSLAIKSTKDPNKAHYSLSSATSGS